MTRPTSVLVACTALLGACLGPHSVVEDHNEDPNAHADAPLPDEAVTEDELATALQTVQQSTDASALTTGTLDVARLPDEVVLQGELATALANDAVGVTRLPLEVVLEDELATDLAALANSAVDVERLPSQVVLQNELTAALQDIESGAALASRTASTQVPRANASIAIDSTTAVELLSLTFDPGAVTSAAFNVHAYAERSGATSGRYEFFLTLDDCTGSSVGGTLWRPPVTSTTFTADAVSFTGHVADLRGSTTVVLCGRKFDSNAPTATVFHRGLVANW